MPTFQYEHQRQPSPREGLKASEKSWNLIIHLPHGHPRRCELQLI